VTRRGCLRTDQFGRTPLELSVSAEVRELLRECLDYERSKQLVSFARKSVVLATSDSEPLCVDFLPLEPSTLIVRSSTVFLLEACTKQDNA
jgi:hypothetical protein